LDEAYPDLCHWFGQVRIPKEERKRLQITHAPSLSSNAQLMKIVDKIADLRDVADSPPVNWPIERRREYFDWANEAVGALPSPNPRLRALFDAIYARRP
jgi:guanosine-3',5'-bis(diphosphate) 3'-pyrophosphohydrolase